MSSNHKESNELLGMALRKVFEESVENGLIPLRKEIDGKFEKMGGKIETMGKEVGEMGGKLEVIGDNMSDIKEKLYEVSDMRDDSHPAVK